MKKVIQMSLEQVVETFTSQLSQQGSLTAAFNLKFIYNVPDI